MCESNNVNAVTRGFLVLTILGALLAPFLGLVTLGLTLVAGLLLYGDWLFRKTLKKEPFVVSGVPIVPEEASPAFPGVPIGSPGVVVTGPSPANPFMNVLLDEIKYNPSRPPAASVTDPALRTTLDDFFRVQWTSDPTDVFGKAQSQREFYTMPSTSIPNDRESYQNWLYLIPGKTCKEGGRDKCVPGTNGAVVTVLNQPN